MGRQKVRVNRQLGGQLQLVLFVSVDWWTEKQTHARATMAPKDLALFLLAAAAAVSAAAAQRLVSTAETHHPIPAVPTQYYHGRPYNQPSYSGRPIYIYNSGNIPEYKKRKGVAK